MLSSNLRITHPSSTASVEQARDIRARAWAYIFSCNEKKAAASSGPDDGTKSKEDSADEPIIQQSA
jgi:hypothetical protein